MTFTQATHKDGKEKGIEIIDPPEDSKPGDRVYFEGQYERAFYHMIFGPEF